jgi:hypothetical protein
MDMESKQTSKQTNVNKMNEIVDALNVLAKHGVLLGGRPPSRVVDEVRISENGVLYIWYRDSKASAPSITASRNGKYYRKFVVDLSRL